MGDREWKRCERLRVAERARLAGLSHEGLANELRGKYDHALDLAVMEAAHRLAPRCVDVLQAALSLTPPEWMEDV